MEEGYVTPTTEEDFKFKKQLDVVGMFESSSMMVVACLKVALFVVQCAAMQFEGEIDELREDVKAVVTE